MRSAHQFATRRVSSMLARSQKKKRSATGCRRLGPSGLASTPIARARLLRKARGGGPGRRKGRQRRVVDAGMIERRQMAVVDRLEVDEPCDRLLRRQRGQSREPPPAGRRSPRGPGDGGRARASSPTRRSATGPLPRRLSWHRPPGLYLTSHDARANGGAVRRNGANVYAISIAIAVASPPPMQSDADAALYAARPKRRDQRDQNARARGADRMAERTGAAVDVDLLVRQARGRASRPLRRRRKPR